MRAIALALTLFVTRVRADHEHLAVTADDLALLAHRLHRRSYLHDPLRMVQNGTALAAVPAAATARGLRTYRLGPCRPERDQSCYQLRSGRRCEVPRGQHARPGDGDRDRELE